VPGQTLAEGLANCPDPAQVLYQAGTHLAQLHTIRFDNKGLLQADGSVKECAVFSGREHVRFLSILEETEALKAGEAELLRAVDVDRFYSGQPNVFCHCDYTPNNIIVEGGAVVSIIDFEWASAAPCMDDLATFDLFADINRIAQYKPDFFRGYRNVRDLPEVFVKHLDFYRYYRLVTMLSYQMRADNENFDRKLLERMLGELAHVLQHGTFLTESIHLAYGRVADEGT
jgi:thiamine kinase-like enzyme